MLAEEVLTRRGESLIPREFWRGTMMISQKEEDIQRFLANGPDRVEPRHGPVEDPITEEEAAIAQCSRRDVREASFGGVAPCSHESSAERQEFRKLA